MPKDTEWSELLKVPNDVIIKHLRVELGKANAYIEELEDKLKQKNIIKGSPEALLEANRSLKKTNANLKEDLKRLREENFKLRNNK